MAKITILSIFYTKLSHHRANTVVFNLKKGKLVHTTIYTESTCTCIHTCTESTARVREYNEFYSNSLQKVYDLVPKSNTYTGLYNEASKCTCMYTIDLWNATYRNCRKLIIVALRIIIYTTFLTLVHTGATTVKCRSSRG